MRDGWKYKDGTEAKEGDVIFYNSVVEGPNALATIIELGERVIRYKRHSDLTTWIEHGVRKDAVLKHRAELRQVLDVAGRYRLAAKAKQHQVITGQKEQDTMKRMAFKGYIIEQDNDGNAVKMLHEANVFSVSKEKAEQALIIEATKGGVVDATTNFVAVVQLLA